MKNKKIPVIIILYNRPLHTKKLLDSIIKAKNYNNFKFYIYCDGPKNNSDKIKIFEIKKILKQYQSFLKFDSTFRNKNIGLLKNITKSLNLILKKFDKAIILEDDLILSNNFFCFMKRSLIKFQNNKNILQISGYSYPIKNNSSHYFLSLTSCWGWAISSKNWNNFYKFLNNNKLIEKQYQIIKASKMKIKEFNYNNSYNYYSMLRKFFKKEINSWGIIFYLYLFINKKLTVFPSSSLVKNNGFDGTGNHKSKNNLFNSEFKNIKLKNFPNKIIESSIHRSKVENFFNKNLSLYAKIKNKIYEKIT